MGFLSDKHIRKFLIGKTISKIVSGTKNHHRIYFTDGESLEVYSLAHPPKEMPSSELVSVPYRKNGEVKQSTQIS